MTSLLEDVQREIVDLHDFFTCWFNGDVDPGLLHKRFLSRLHPQFNLIAPEGHIIAAAQFKSVFEPSWGTSPDFRIQIRDVVIQHDFGHLILATYTEWQTGSRHSENANNARIASVVMEKRDPLVWVHLQETWLPEQERTAGSFDF